MRAYRGDVYSFSVAYRAPSMLHAALTEETNYCRTLLSFSLGIRRFNPFQFLVLLTFSSSPVPLPAKSLFTTLV